MKERELSVIDTLGQGFATVTQRAWIISIPVILDLYYWLGPKLSVAPLVQDIVAFLEVGAARGGSTEYEQALEASKELLAQLGQQFNLFSLLSMQLLGVPSLMLAYPSLTDRLASVITVRNWSSFLGLLALLILTGLFVGSIYLSFVNQAIRGAKVIPDQPLRRIGTYWLRLVLLGVLFVGAVLAVGLPLSLVLSVTTLISGVLASVLALLFWMASLWLVFLLYFTVEAIFTTDAGPLQAIWNSVNVVWRNSWSALGLILVINLLKLGLPIIWRAVTELNPLGAFISIVGNAFVGTGLVTASFIFYRDRYAKWQTLREAQGG